MWGGASVTTPARRRRSQTQSVPYVDGIWIPLSSTSTEKSLAVTTAYKSKMRTYGRKKGMTNKTAKVMAAFILGQAIQIVFHLLSNVNFMRFEILFCIAAGVIITIAVIAGITLAENEKPKQKTYKEWAEPEVDLHEQ